MFVSQRASNLETQLITRYHCRNKQVSENVLSFWGRDATEWFIQGWGTFPSTLQIVSGAYLLLSGFHLSLS